MEGLDLISEQELPKGWTKCSLANFRRRKSVSFNPAKNLNETVELYSIPSHETGKPEILESCELGSSKQFVDSRDVLISKINPRLNRAWVVGDFSKHRKIASTEWIVFENSEAISPLFLGHLLTIYRIRDFLSHNASGVGGSLTRVKPALMDSIEIGLPPLHEQKRIVAKIEELFSELDNGIASLKTAREQLKVYRQAVLKHAFEGKLTAKWREENADKLETPDQLLARIQQEREARYQQQLDDWKAAVKAWEDKGKEEKKPGKPRLQKVPTFPFVTSSELPAIPEIWEWVHPEHLSSATPHSIGIGPFGSNLKVSDYKKAGMPLIFVRNITRKNYTDDLKYIDIEKSAELYAHQVKPLDLIITKMGDPPGDCDIYPRARPVAVLTADCLKFRVFDEYVDRHFYKHCINSNLVKKQLGLITKGVAQKKISVDRFKTIALPFPPLQEQKQISSKIEKIFEEVERREFDVDVQLNKAETLRQSILKKAFSGKLVPQDPTDEPASELLARIRADKTAANGLSRSAAKQGRKSVSKACR